VTVYSAQQESLEVGLSMELIRGQPLSDLVRYGGPLAAEEATFIGIRLCHALAAVHGAGLIHRDVKARNVLREAGGRIVLMDFGAGRDLTAVQSGAMELAGTPVYMAPEVLAGRPATPATDLYSLGVLLYFLVAGRYPVEGHLLTDIALAHSLGMRRLLSDSRPDLPDAFVHVVERAMAPRPEDRYPSPGALLNALAAAIPDTGAWNAVPVESAGGSPATLVGQGDSAGDVRETTVSDTRHFATVGAAVPWLGVLAALACAIGVLGFLMSVGFDVTLGRTAAFTGESVFDWWVWGIRSLILPAYLMMIALIVVRLAVTGGRLTGRAVPRCARLARSVRDRAVAASARSGLSDPTAKAQALLGAQVVALVVVWWWFSPLVSAVLSDINTGDAASLAMLAPEHGGTRLWFRATLSLLLLAMSAAWWALLAPRLPERRVRDPVTVTGGLLVITLVLLMLTVPYRVLVHNAFQRVDFGGQRCYAIGARDADLLLHCPDAVPPRNRVIQTDDARLRRLPVVESIFTRHPQGLPLP
jgi:hypothetical protein